MCALLTDDFVHLSFILRFLFPSSSSFFSARYYYHHIKKNATTSGTNAREHHHMSRAVEEVKYKERRKEKERKKRPRKTAAADQGSARKTVFFRDVSDALAQFFARRTSDEDVVFLRFRCSNNLPLFPTTDAEIQLVDKI